jgi:hypothetical protein
MRLGNVDFREWGDQELNGYVDSETSAWFELKSKEAEQHMAAVLRIYAKAKKAAATMYQSD